MARKKKRVSKRMQKALEKHDAFLRSHGIDPLRKPVLRGVPIKELSEAPKPAKPPIKNSDTVPGSAGKREGHGSGGRIIGQPYHKGPLMVLGDKSELKNSKRRD